MLRRLIQRGDVFFAKSWRIVAFQPVLYFFIFGASIRLWRNQTPPPNFDLISHDFYYIWLGIGILAPVLSGLSWYLIQKRSGIWRFRGMWFRLAADIGILTNLVTYHIITSLLQAPVIYEEGRIYSRYIVGASIMFVIFLIIRDLWTIKITETLAGHIHSGHDE